MQEFFHGQVVMSSDGFENAFDERARLERLVLWNGDVVFAVQPGCDADMRAVLPVELIPQNAQRFDHIIAVDVAGDFHGTSTSSRTK